MAPAVAYYTYSTFCSWRRHVAQGLAVAGDVRPAPLALDQRHEQVAA